MTALHNDVFDNGLNTLTNNTEKLWLLTADPGLTFANIATYACGYKTSPTVGSPEDGDSDGGRKVTVSAITDGVVSVSDSDGDATATHFALTDDSESKILATRALSSGQVVTDGNTFTLTEFDIGIPDPA